MIFNIALPRRLAKTQYLCIVKGICVNQKTPLPKLSDEALRMFIGGRIYPRVLKQFFIKTETKSLSIDV